MRRLPAGFTSGTVGRARRDSRRWATLGETASLNYGFSVGGLWTRDKARRAPLTTCSPDRATLGAETTTQRSARSRRRVISTAKAAVIGTPVDRSAGLPGRPLPGGVEVNRRDGRVLREADRHPRRPRQVRQPGGFLPAAADRDLRRPLDPAHQPAQQHRRGVPPSIPVGRLLPPPTLEERRELWQRPSPKRSWSTTTSTGATSQRASSSRLRPSSTSRTRCAIAALDTNMQPLDRSMLKGATMREFVKDGKIV